MAFDSVLADRLRDLLAPAGPVRELRMFGGLAFMLHGHMACCVWGEGVLVRLGAEGVARAVAAGEADAFRPSGKQTALGLALVADAVCLDDDDLQAWVDRAVAWVRTLPPKGLA
jgi:TfoX/Sxy family transcriptional regulator of competence genes